MFEVTLTAEFILHFLTETICPSPRTDTRQKDRAILPVRSRESAHSHVHDMRRTYGQRGEKVFFAKMRELRKRSQYCILSVTVN